MLTSITDIARRLREASGPTVLTLGAVADGEFIKRVGATAVGGTPAGSLDITGLTAADPALGDELPIYDVSAAANRKVTVEELGFILTGLVGGRLTLTSGTSVTTADVTAAGTLYYAIHTHDKIALYDGTRWKMYTFTERSLSLTLTSGKNYDVFLYDNAGTLTLELSAAWTNDTTRADALTTQDGVQVKSGATTRRYLGTIRASGTNTTEDSKTKRFLWNHYNRVERKLNVTDTTDTWTYSDFTIRQANASTANQVEVVIGIAGSLVSLTCFHVGESTIAGDSVWASIGKDRTTASDADVVFLPNTPAANTRTALMAILNDHPAGYHYYAWLERGGSGGGTETFQGDAGGAVMRTGLGGFVVG